VGRNTVAGFVSLAILLLVCSFCTGQTQYATELERSYGEKPCPVEAQIKLALALQSSEKHFVEEHSTHASLPNQELNIPPNIRLMLFSPHPDDETISSGGLIQRVLAKGGSVRVVFMTNGDGYLDGIKCELKDHQQASAHDFIEYGNRRQNEAIHALTALGLEPSDAIFFSFPDGGIDDLWEGNWSISRPYTSPFTKLDHPTYKDSFSRWVKYAGTDLEKQIITTIRDFKPDWIVMPDPRDEHPDHYTTGIFVMDAMRELREARDSSVTDTQLFSYLVHFMDYPSTPAWLTEVNKVGIGGGPIYSGLLSETQWFSLPISSPELAVKRRAIMAHASQFEPLGSFLQGFLIRYEMFGKVSPIEVKILPSLYAIHFGRPNS
jgi:LmbE family N-acetylglucosaminyl deacetylase